MPTCHVFLGDLHAGSKLAPLVPFTDDDGIDYSSKQTRTSAVLAGFLAQALADVKQAALGHTLVLHLGGDLVDGVAHHDTTQTVGDWRAQRALAVQLLQPWVNAADALHGLQGTDAHVGDNGDEDKTVCEKLGVPVKPFWRLDCSGRVLDWAHHVGLSGKWWTKENSLVALANNTRAEYLERGERPPDMIVRHHVHRHARAHAKGTDIVTCFGWQSMTSHVYRFAPNQLLTVGVVLWFPETNGIKPLPYHFPAPPIEPIHYVPKYEAPKPIPGDY